VAHAPVLSNARGDDYYKEEEKTEIVAASNGRIRDSKSNLRRPQDAPENEDDASLEEECKENIGPGPFAIGSEGKIIRQPSRGKRGFRCVSLELC
jgi:hypothetical protein